MKKLLLSLSLIFSFTLATNAGCYEFWLEDYDAAEAKYLADIEYCLSVMQGARLLGMCLEEADRSFDYNIHEAGIDFYRCTFR